MNKTCGICWDEETNNDVPFIEFYGCNHAFCTFCIKSHIKEHVLELGKMPQCPTCNAGKSRTAVNITKDKVTLIWANDPSLNNVLEAYDRIELESALQTMGCVVRCPGQPHLKNRKHCEMTVLVDDKHEKICVNCPSCKKKFCSICYQIYHYRTTCAEARAVQIYYHEWLSKKNGANNDDLDRRLRELQGDEQYKSEKCRHCPSCNRLVEKIDGCDAMVCGENYHKTDGRDKQNGCGHRFDWKNARNYVPAPINRFVLSADKEIRELVSNTTNMNHGYNCQVCQKEIVGMRFSCINCEFLDICEECEKSHVSSFHAIPKHEPHSFEIYVVPNRRLK